MAQYQEGYSKGKNVIVWQDRKHFMWFPFSFTIYELTKERLYEKHGFFSTSYDELLLYRVVDLTLIQTLSQKLFGTGTLVLTCKADSTPKVRLENIRNPLQVKDMLSDMIEDARSRHRVVGREFYSANTYFEDGDVMDDGDGDI